MKKSFVLTFVLAAFSFAGTYAQTGRPTQKDAPAQEQKSGKAAPSPGSGTSTPATAPSGQRKAEEGKKVEPTTNGRKAEPATPPTGAGKSQGKGHKKGQFKSKKGAKTKTNGHGSMEKHEGHDHKKGEHDHDGKMKAKPNAQENPPVGAPTKKQGGNN